MADIFVSYAREDRDWVARFSHLLRESSGRGIWWDRSIVVGEQFDDAIQRALDDAPCVVVVWSKSSVNSRWVKTEAREASRRDILLPVIIENVTPPLEFRSFQTADLSAWHGEVDHESFLELTQAVRAMINRAVREPQDRAPSPLAAEPGHIPEVRGQGRGSETQRRSSPDAHPRGRRLYYGAAATLAAVLLLVVVGVMAGVIRKGTSLLSTSPRSEQAKPPTLSATPDDSVTAERALIAAELTDAYLDTGRKLAYFDNWGLPPSRQTLRVNQGVLTVALADALGNRTVSMSVDPSQLPTPRHYNAYLPHISSLGSKEATEVVRFFSSYEQFRVALVSLTSKPADFNGAFINATESAREATNRGRAALCAMGSTPPRMFPNGGLAEPVPPGCSQGPFSR